MDLSQKISEEFSLVDTELKNKEAMFSELEELEHYNGKDKVLPVSAIYKEIQQRKSLEPKEKYMTGFQTLDDKTTGIYPGQLWVLSAPTGQGKTILLQNITENLSRENIPCLWFTYEVPQDEFVERFCGDIPNFYMPRKNVDYNIAWLKKRVLEGIAKFNTKVIFIDHLHYLLDMKALSMGNSSLIIGGIMRELKQLAIQTNTSIFLVAHMKHTSIDTVPTKESIRDSSFISQEADVVLMLWRCREKDSNSPTGFVYTDYSNLLIDKVRRTGNNGFLKLGFYKGRFKEVSVHGIDLRQVADDYKPAETNGSESLENVFG
jgi:replicative DNA helicase